MTTQLEHAKIVNTWWFILVLNWFITPVMYDRGWTTSPTNIAPAMIWVLEECFSGKQHGILRAILCFFRDYIYIYTSSTAQGGGGSFKNRKPIGEVGCCESGMAKRIHWWIERCLISLPLSLSFSAYLPTYLLTYLPTYLSIYRSLYLSLSFSSNYLSSYLSIYLSISPSIDLLLL